MPGLVPGIHVLRDKSEKDVDGRDEPGHDENGINFSRLEVPGNTGYISGQALRMR